MEAVGIGCIWFALNPESYDEDKFSPSEHLQEIKRALEGVDNVSNVVLSGYGNVISGLGMPGDYDEDEGDNNYFPIYSNVLIAFDIFMPARLQEKYSHDRTADGVETFHVKLRYDEMPVAYIHYSLEARGPAGLRNFSPSNAVIFIRKYLAEKLQGHSKVQFQVLGPSPFHADVFLEPAEGGALPGTAEDLTAPGDGYRTLYFLTKARKANDTVMEFIVDYHKILSAYYSLVRARVHSHRVHAALVEGAMHLLHPARRRAPWARFVHWYALRAQIDSVFESLLAEKDEQGDDGVLLCEH